MSKGSTLSFLRLLGKPFSCIIYQRLLSTFDIPLTVSAEIIHIYKISVLSHTVVVIKEGIISHKSAVHSLGSISNMVSVQNHVA